MALDLKEFDPAEYLRDAESLAAYLEDAFEDEDPDEFLLALGVVARVKGADELARDAGVSLSEIDQFKASGTPELATVLAVLKSLGVAIRVASLSSECLAHQAETASSRDD